MGQQFEDVGRAFGQCRTADGTDYWDDPDARHGDHRRHVRNLLIACGFVALTGIVIHSSLLMMLVLLVPFVLLEWSMLRRSGKQRLPQIPPAGERYEPGAGNVFVQVELEPNDPFR